MPSKPELVFRVHALQRMFEKSISEVEVRDVIENGEVIERRVDSDATVVVVLGFPQGRPLHVVTTEVAPSDVQVIITVYEPDPERWSNDFCRRL